MKVLIDQPGRRSQVALGCAAAIAAVAGGGCWYYQSMRSDPVASPYVEQALAIAKFDPGMYEVVKVFAGPSKPTR